MEQPASWLLRWRSFFGGLNEIGDPNEKRSNYRLTIKVKPNELQASGLSSPLVTANDKTWKRGDDFFVTEATTLSVDVSSFPE